MCGLRQKLSWDEAANLAKLIGVVESRFAAEALHCATDVVHQLRDVVKVRRQVEASDAHCILGAVALAAQTDGHVDVEFLDWLAELLVVVTHPERNCCEERVVHRVPVCLCTITKVAETNVKVVEVVVDAPLRHQGRQRCLRSVREADQ